MLGSLIGGFITSGINAAAARVEGDRSRAWQEEENEKQRQWAAEQAAIDRQENYQYGEMSADAADARSRALYNDLQSPAAMLAQYQEAGLSPSLMFGGSGAGGQSVPSGAQGQGANGISTPMSYNYISPLEAAQTAQAMAQTRLIDAQTQEKLGLTIQSFLDLSKTAAETDNINAQTAFAKAQESQTKVETMIMELKAPLEMQKLEAESEKLRNEAAKGVWEIISAKANAQVDIETIKSRIAQAAANVKLTNAQEILTRAQVKLTKAEEQKALEQIKVWEQELLISWQDVCVKLMQAENQAEYNRILNEYYIAQVAVLERQTDIKDKEVINSIINNYIGTGLKIFGTALSITSPTKIKGLQ